MSFTTDVKKEIAQIELESCCAKAQLAALIQLCSSLNISNGKIALQVRTENADTAKRVWKLVKEMYHVDGELSVVRKMKLKKNNVYHIRFQNQVREILEDLGILTEEGLQERPSGLDLKKECCARAYLSGAFLASGSANDPTKTSYHLEIAANTQKHAAYIQRVMKRFNLNGKIIERRNQFVVYLKMSEQISDFLRCIGSFEGVMRFEDERITRDFKNSLTRLDNCEVANEMKSQKAARSHLDDIEKIEQAGKMNLLDEKLLDIVRLRKDFPEASLLELAKEYEKRSGTAMSKSGMKHRFTKIKEIADKISD